MVQTKIKLDLDAGGLISSAAAAKEALRDIDREIKKASDAKDDARVGQLYHAKNRLTTASSGFEHDIGNMNKSQLFQSAMDKQAKGQKLSKAEEQYVAELHNINGNFKKIVESMLEAAKKGDSKEIANQAAQFGNQAGDFHKTVEAANAPTGMTKGIKGTVQAIGIGQIANAINEGFSLWESSINRSGIINQYGSGDIMGGRIADERRNANLVGGLAQAGLGIAGAIVGTIIAPGAGTVLGGTLGAAGGKALATALKIGPDQEENEAAFMGLWQNQSGQAMNLAAVQGNPANVRGAWKDAADLAAEFGYSAEEGMEAMKQAAQQGLDGSVVRQSFDYERRTGADRGTLMGISNMSARYGAGDALGNGWAGLQASGMKTGQYNEYLRAMQRVMEDGISKGFVRSSEQVAQNLTMLAQMTGNDPLWQGENGARRLSEMNAGLEGATGLQTTSDIMAFRAAQELSGGGSYIDAMKIMEKGLTPELFEKYMKLTASSEGGGREGIVERMRQTFSLNYTNADALYKAWQENPNMSREQLQAKIDEYKNSLPSADSKELNAVITTEQIKNAYAEAGQAYFDKNYQTLEKELEKVKQEIVTAIRSKEKAEDKALAQKSNSLMSGWGDMPMYNTPSGIRGSSFNSAMEAAKLAPASSPQNIAYNGIWDHFNGLSAEEQRIAGNSGHYMSIWNEAGGDLTKMYDIIQRTGKTKPVDADAAVKGFFDKRGDTGVLNFLGSLAHLGDNDSTARDRLEDLQRNTRIDSPDYTYLTQAFQQLSTFKPEQKEEADRNNSLNEILKRNELTGQKFYEAVVELSRQMGVTIVYDPN